MWNHWAYKDKDASSGDQLEQGDVLQPTPQLKELLTQYHPYYAAHESNRFYVVLTQSCDLVRRQGPCHARYISLAPVRPLTEVVQREFGAKIKKIDGTAYASDRTQADVEKFLHRLFNNNESSYFYFETEAGAGLYEAMCAILALPISFKAEHYDIFLNARLVGIQDSFQAKLGWLLGQMYSRVGTRDFEPTILKDKVRDVTESLALWLETPRFKALPNLIEKYKSEHPDQAINAQIVEELIGKLPKRKDEAIRVVLDTAAKLGIAIDGSTERRRLRSALENDAQFSSLFK